MLMWSGCWLEVPVKWMMPVDGFIKPRMYATNVMFFSFPATADKVTAALADPTASDMKLEDLEGHLNSLKKMFIEKQKMMDGMNTATN